MEAKAAISLLRQDGLSLRAYGDTLKVKPSEKITEKHRQLIRSYKAEIIREMQRAGRTPTNWRWHYESHLAAINYQGLSTVEKQAIALDRAAHDWIRHHYRPLPKYDQAELSRRMSEARQALIDHHGLPDAPTLKQLEADFKARNSQQEGT